MDLVEQLSEKSLLRIWFSDFRYHVENTRIKLKIQRMNAKVSELGSGTSLQTVFRAGANTTLMMAISLIKMFRAGPEVSLRGSPTCSQTQQPNEALIQALKVCWAAGFLCILPCHRWQQHRERRFLCPSPCPSCFPRYTFWRYPRHRQC